MRFKVGCEPLSFPRAPCIDRRIYVCIYCATIQVRVLSCPETNDSIHIRRAISKDTSLDLSAPQ